MTENQIDHVCVGSSGGLYRGADAAPQAVSTEEQMLHHGDHHMVLATLKLQLKHCKPLTNANKTRNNVDLSSDKETAVSLGSTLACVASVSVEQRAKNGEERGFRRFARAAEK